MTHGDVQGSRACRGCPCVPAHDAIEDDRDDARRGPLRWAETSDERVLGHTDGRNVEPDAGEAGDPEARGMKLSVTVDEEDIGSVDEPAQCGLDARQLTVSEVRRDIREADANADPDRLDRVEVLGVADHCGDAGFLPSIARIHAGDPPAGRHVVPIRDARGEGLLLFSQAQEETSGRQLTHEKGCRDPPVFHSHSFREQRREGIPQDGAPVRTDDPARASRVRMIGKPGRDRPRGSHVPQRNGHRPTRRNMPLGDGAEAAPQGAVEGWDHEGAWLVLRKTFLARTPSAPSGCPSS